MYALDERNSWYMAFDQGKLTSYYLEEYKKNRDNPCWRSTRELEKLCEYAILLERKVEILEQERKKLEDYIDLVQGAGYV